MVAPSQIERVILKFRKALLDTETRATQQTLAAYADARQSLIDQIQAFAKTLESRPLTAGEEWRDERAKALLSQVETRMTELARTASPIITNGQTDAVGLAEHQALGMAVIAAANDPAIAEIVANSWNRLNTGAVEALIGRMSDGSPLSATLSGMSPATSDAIRTELTKSVSLGLNPRATAAALEGQVDISGARLLTIARTEQLEAFREASRQSHMANDDILSGVMWCCDLSSDTCAACLDLSGEIFPVDYVMDTHPNCRCSLIPVVKGIDPPPLQSGEDFFASLSPEEQDKVLTAAGGAAYRAGDVSLSDFRTLVPNDRWGASYQQDSLRGALQRAQEGQDVAA